jgi:transposase
MALDQRPGQAQYPGLVEQSWEIKSGQGRGCIRSAQYQIGETMQSWQQEIATMWRFTRNNGITEGFHNKMETISRQAYGFRNFQNYRMRVKMLCG